MNEQGFFAKNWRDLFKPIIVLLCICLIIPAALAVTNKVTAPKIAELEQKQKQESMKLLFPDADSFSEKSDYYEVEQNGTCCGYIFTTAAKGYGGAVSVMTAVTTDGTVKAVKILSVDDETPGLGQNAKKEDFYGQLAGLSAEKDVTLNKQDADAAANEITPITGATVTSTAVKNAVNQALEIFRTVSKGGAENE